MRLTFIFPQIHILKLNEIFSATAEQIFIRQRVDSIVVQLRSRSNEGQVRVRKVRVLSQANLIKTLTSNQGLGPVHYFWFSPSTTTKLMNLSKRSCIYSLTILLSRALTLTAMAARMEALMTTPSAPQSVLMTTCLGLCTPCSTLYNST